MFLVCLRRKNSPRDRRNLERFTANLLRRSLSPVSCYLRTSSHIYRVCIIQETSCTKEYRELFQGEYRGRDVTLTVALHVASSLMVIPDTKKYNFVMETRNFSPSFTAYTQTDDKSWECVRVRVCVCEGGGTLKGEAIQTCYRTVIF